MKTLTRTISTLATLAILFSINLNASEYYFNEESYVDDIPFNTVEIYKDIMTDQKLAEFDFEEEEYIDDIPVDSGCLTPECLYRKAVSVDFQLEEEEYIDDIKFNTAFVSAASLYLQAMSVNFDFEEEEFVNDLSFNSDNVSTQAHYHTLILKGFDLDDEDVDILSPWIINISLHEYSERLLEKISEFSFLEPGFSQ